jgi:eukaryotic-like serine/threonine-protein kinase
MAETNQPGSDTLLGKLVIERGLATSDDIEYCIQKQREVSLESSAPGENEPPNQRSLAQVMVDEGIITQKQIERIRPEVEEQSGKRQIPGYQILERLGAGAMATVYKAKQLNLDRMVAIKVLPRKHTNNDDFVKRFYAEGKAAAKLNHANIVGAIDVGQAGDTHYFVMEYVQGRSVFEDIQDKGPFSEEEALKITIDIARALEHAHKAGFVHRDVKPKNIMLTVDNVAKLADMGLARAVSDREAAEAEAGKAFGTPYYISPEQIKGDLDVDKRADIYSLGCTLYHMVTGRVPFDGPNPSAVMRKHLNTDVTPVDHINHNLTRGLAEIIEVCMAKNRKQRYASAGDLLRDLEAVSMGEAPPFARKMFDLSELSALDQSAGAMEIVTLPQPEPLVESPLFWIAAIGWFAVVLLLIVVIIMLVGT